ncbi:MAG: CPBP family intramembrane metalloprotease [Puniceicoccales bacterium]|nr:CPBP family intramembrane metalloprotease [Puniceicoccales bacterium]
MDTKSEDSKADAPARKRPSAIALFLLFYGGTLLLAAVLAPLFFFATKCLAEPFPSGLFAHFLDRGFGKFFARAKLIAFCALLVPLLKISGIGKAEMGFEKISKVKFFSILLAGSAVVWLVFAGLAWKNTFTMGVISIAACLRSMPKFIAAAAAISFIEEVIFRGIIFRLFVRDLGAAWASIFSALFFAHCHVGAGSSTPVAAADVTIFSGFQCVAAFPLEFFHNFNALHFLNLAMLGVLLAALLLKFGSLFASMAFHFGAVFAIVTWRNFFKIAKITGGWQRSIGILDTWITFAAQLLAVALLIFPMWRQSRRSRSQIPAA